MMRFVALLTLAMALVAPVSMAFADSVSAPPSSLKVGQQFTLVVVVDAPTGADVEINSAAETWGGLEVIQIDTHDIQAVDANTARHTFTLTVAPFVPGSFTFAPEAIITVGGQGSVRSFPAAPIAVQSTLAPGSLLQLSPNPPPGTIGGGQSPWLVPGIALGALVLLAIVFWLAARALAWVRRRLPAPEAPFVPEPAPPAILTSVEDQLSLDPVAAYRAMATSVRAALANQYGFPARALTTHELQRRMEAEGVDRWQSRLVRGLLDECDQVVYAGYLPAMDRRTADLAMARELLEGSA